MALGSLLLVAGAGSSEERSPPEVPPESAPRRRLPPARSTAVLPAELPEDPSAFATVVETADFEGEHKTVADLLGRSVGVQLRRFGGPGQPSEISIRGSTSSQVVVLLDGVRLNTAQTGTVDLSTLPLALVDRVEVARGGGSAWAGSGAIGGVVNVVTAAPDGERETNASFSGGSWNTYQGSVAHSDRLGPIDFRAGYHGFTTDGDWSFQSLEIRSQGLASGSQKLERINNDSESHTALLQGAVDVASGWRLSATDHAHFVSRGQPGPDDRPTQPGGGQSSNGRERITRNVAALRLDAEELLPGISAQARVSYLFERSRFKDPKPDFGLPIETRQRNRSGRLATAFESDHDWGPTSHRGSLSLEGGYQSLSSNEQSFQRRTSFGAFVQDEIGLWDARLSLVPGLRFDATEKFGSEWIPHLGLIVQPFAWLRLKGNIERSYRAPDFDELFFPNKGFIRGNPNLDPEKAWNADAGFELGLERALWLRDVRLQAVYFHQDISNSIVFQRINATTIQPTNTEDATVDGVEVGGRLGVAGWVELSGNWTWQDAKLDRAQTTTLLGQPGSALPGRAEHEWTLRLRVGPDSGLFKLVAERSYTSKLPINFDDSANVSSRTVYDVSASLDFAQVWSQVWPQPWRLAPGRLVGSVTVTNLTDQSIRDAVGFPQPGRALTFGLEASW